MLALRKRVQVAVVLVAALAAAIGVRGQGGTPAPVLVVLNSAAPNPFGAYLPEVLRAEGINSLDVVQLSALSAPMLQSAAVVVLAETPLTASQALLFTNYVAGGGRLVAMRPDAQLAGVLGISPAAGSTTDGYVLIDQSGSGAGLQQVTLPFKGVSDHFGLAGATTVATLYATRDLSANRPAVVRHNRTAAWSFDLARSTAYVRQGDPAFAGLDRDGQPFYSTGDIFFQTIDLERIGVPHADVQMRLFSRVITDLLVDSQPLPRLWYFPGASRTVLVPTSDSHTSWPLYEQLVDAVESVGGRISFFMPRYIDPSQIPITTFAGNGHDFGLHPYVDDAEAGDFGYSRNATWFAGADAGALGADRPPSSQRMGRLGRSSARHGRLRRANGPLLLLGRPGPRLPGAAIAGPRVYDRQRSADEVREPVGRAVAGVSASHLPHRRAADLR